VTQSNTIKIAYNCFALGDRKIFLLHFIHVNRLQDQSIPFRDIDLNPSKKSLTSVRQYPEIGKMKHFKNKMTLT